MSGNERLNPHLFDPWYDGKSSKSEGWAWEDEDGEYWCINGAHVDENLAIESFVASYRRLGLYDLDVSEVGFTHAQWTPDEQNEEWGWFHTEPGPTSQPVTLVGLSCPNPRPTAHESVLAYLGPATLRAHACELINVSRLTMLIGSIAEDALALVAPDDLRAAGLKMKLTAAQDEMKRYSPRSAAPPEPTEQGGE